MSRFILGLSRRRHGPSHTSHLPILSPCFATQLVPPVSRGTTVETHEHSNLAVNLTNILQIGNLDRRGHRISAAEDFVQKTAESEPLSLSCCGFRVGGACRNSAVGRNSRRKDGAVRTTDVDRTGDDGRAVTIEDLVEKTAQPQALASL